MIYVLDPALNSEKPLLVNDWYNKMGALSDLQGIVCNEYTYDPFDYCFKATHTSDSFAQQDQSDFLKKEWDRMQKLGFRPTEILGDTPPWRD